MMNALWLDGWVVLGTTTKGKTTEIAAEYLALPEACPKCGCVGRIYRHGSEPVAYRDAPAFGKQIVIAVDVKRFRCRECSKTFMQPLPDMHPVRQLTMRCVEHLRDQCKTRNYAEMSRETGIGESVIRDVCNEQYASFPEFQRPFAPTILGIDELTLIHRRRCIFVDVGTKRTIELLVGMTKTSVIHWLSHLPGKERVRIVTMDMWDDYKSAVYAVLPNAKVVVDRWHIQKMGNTALDAVRSKQRRLWAQQEKALAEAEGRKAKKVKNPWRVKRLLMARGKNLKARASLALDGLLKNTPAISEAWHTKEAFFDIWENDTREAAEAAYEQWKASIPAGCYVEFSAIFGTVKNWHTEIFNYFDHRYTNAFTEATNGLVKQINRGGKGYSFKHIRAKALMMTHESDGRFGVCESCLGQFPVEFLSRHKEVTFCASCHRRFHTEDVVTDHGDSTLKNG